jgi:tetratricopeptide (TPR) repeat protein
MNTLVMQLARDLNGPALGEVEGTLDTLALNHPRFAGQLSRVHRMLVERYLERGMVDRALATARRMLELYGRDEAAAARAQTTLATVTLCKRDARTAMEILNACVATHMVSEEVFEAWMLLAAIYEDEFSFRDALTIYRKVYRECPRGVELPWLARIKMGELAEKAECEESAESIFAEVDSADQPFAVPRLIARYYAGQVSETAFTDAWHFYYPEDWYYLYHMARKAIMKGEKVIAEIYLNQLLQSLPSGSMRYVQVYQMVNNLDKF